MKDSTERHLSRWAPSIVALVGFAVTFGMAYGRIEAHVQDESVHMPYDKKIQEFVPRTEVQSLVEQLNETIRMSVELSRDSEGRNREDIARINDKLDRIQELLLNQYGSK